MDEAGKTLQADQTNQPDAADVGSVIGTADDKVHVGEERTLVILKPDAVQRGLVGRIIARFEDRGLRVAALRMIRIDEGLARRHYAVHEGKPFYEPLVAYITSGPVVTMVLAGPRAIDVVRTTMGATDPAKALPGTIRGDLGVAIGRNLVHGSDGPETAAFELGLFFGEEDILNYARDTDRWVVE
jgi:nucleoside-diphosphate kinase